MSTPALASNLGASIPPLAAMPSKSTASVCLLSFSGILWGLLSLDAQIQQRETRNEEDANCQQDSCSEAAFPSALTQPVS